TPTGSTGRSSACETRCSTTRRPNALRPFNASRKASAGPRAPPRGGAARDETAGVGSLARRRGGVSDAAPRARGRGGAARDETAGVASLAGGGGAFSTPRAGGALETRGEAGALGGA